MDVLHDLVALIGRTDLVLMVKMSKDWLIVLFYAIVAYTHHPERLGKAERLEFLAMWLGLSIATLSAIAAAWAYG